MKRRKFLAYLGVGLSGILLPIAIPKSTPQIKFSYAGSLGHIYDPKTLELVAVTYPNNYNSKNKNKCEPTLIWIPPEVDRKIALKLLKS